MKRNPRILFRAVGLALAAGMAALSGCGGDEAEAPRKKERVAPAAFREAKGSSTVPLLRLRPEATLAIATPSLKDPYGTGLAIAERSQADPADVSDVVRKSARELAAATRTPGEINNHMDLLSAWGIDVEAPAAVFLDASPAQETWFESAESQDDSTQDSFPAFAFIARCRDASAAKGELRRVIGAVSGTDISPQTAEVNGREITLLKPSSFACFLVGDRMVAGSSRELVAGIAQRLQEPDEVRYGSPDCPVDDAREIVALIPVSQLSDLESALQSAENGAGLGGILLNQFLPWDAADIAETAQGDDPLIATLSIRPGRVLLETHLDVEKHPAILRAWGKPPVLTHLQTIPDTTKGLLALGLTPEWKALLIKGIRESSPDDPTAGALAETLLNALGDEAALIATGMRDDLPVAALLVDMKQPQLFRGALQLLGAKLTPLDPGDPNGVSRVETGVDLPTPLYARMGETELYVANDPDLLRQTVQHTASGGLASDVAASLDPLTPRYSLMLINQAGVTDILVPALVEDSERAAYEPLIDMFREFQASQELANGWQRNVVALHLTEPAGS